MAFTESEQYFDYFGSRRFVIYKLTGDGSDTAWTAPVGTIHAAWIQEYTSGATGTSVSISYSTNVVTFNTAPASGQVIHVHVIGA